MRIKCATVLDGYSGVGCTAIKLANSCHTVLANEKEQLKLECLEANESVYGVENITNLNYDFLEMPEIKADVVFLAPQCVREFEEMEVDPAEHYSPPLSAIVEKALTITNNIVLLMPATTNVERLAALMAETLEKSPRGNGSCSLEIQKLYYMSSLKYLLVLYGPLVNKEITLSDELNFIYKMIRSSGQGNFDHKKLIKEIRERHGMVALLRFLQEYNELGSPVKVAA